MRARTRMNETGVVSRVRRRHGSRLPASMHWLAGIARRDPTLFVLWQLGVTPDAGS
jgi:hypothetical protein